MGDAYEVTKKPRGPGYIVSSGGALPANDGANASGRRVRPDYDAQAVKHEIRSGTYFERGDVLVAKITPSFENGKQGSRH